MKNVRERLEYLKRYKMTIEVKEELDRALETMTDEELEDFSKEFRKHRHTTKDRKEIEWHPTIDRERCVSCKLCYDFCPKSVYSFMDEMVKVTNPYECVLMCSHCTTLCPECAISFPKDEDFIDYIEYR